MFISQVQNIRLRSQALDGQSLKSFRLHLHERTMVFIDSKEPELEIFALTHIVLQICSSAYLMDEAHKSQDVRKCKIWPKLFLLAYFSPSVSRNNEWAANWHTGRFLHYFSQKFYKTSHFLALSTSKNVSLNSQSHSPLGDHSQNLIPDWCLQIGMNFF